MEAINYDQAAQIARNHGFSFYDKCQCGGTLRYNWKKSGFFLEIMPNKKMFTLKKDGKYGPVIITSPIENLESSLNEFTL